MFRASPYLESLTSTGGAINLSTLQADVPVAVMLEVGVAKRPPGEQGLLRLTLTGEIPSLGRRAEKLDYDVQCIFAPAELPAEPVPSAIRSTLSKITIFRMQERVWDALDKGDVNIATRQLEIIATRLFDLGEAQLARAAMLEAGRIAQGGLPTAKGRKELKYGTRGLSIASRRGSYD